MTDNFSNIFNKEPKFNCPVCGTELHTEWVDNGFGQFSVQASPYYCECGWVEGGCPAKECLQERCYSWDTCQGKSKSKLK